MADGFMFNGKMYYAEGLHSDNNFQALAGSGPVQKGIVGLLMVLPRLQPGLPQWIPNDAWLRRTIPNPDAEYLSHALFRPSKDKRIPNGAAGVFLLPVGGRSVAVGGSAPTTQASLTALDGTGSPANALVLKSADWGVKGNGIQTLLTNGTTRGKKFQAVYGGKTQTVDNIVVAGAVLTLGHADTAGYGTHATFIHTKAQVNPNGGLGAGTNAGVVIEQQVKIDESQTWSPGATRAVAFDGKITFLCANAQTVDFTIIGIDKATGATVTEPLAFAGDTTKTTSHAFSAITSIACPNLTTDTYVTCTWNAFDLPIATFDTLQKVAARITQKAANGFSAVVDIVQTVNVADLDKTASTTIENTTLDYTAELYYLIAGINAGISFLTAERADNAVAIAADFPLTNLAGGADGVVDATDWQICLDAARDLQINHVLMLTDDQAVIAQGLAHCVYMNGEGCFERDLWAAAPVRSKLTDLYAYSAALNSEFANLYVQEVKIYDDTNTAQWVPPKYTAAFACGCEAGRLPSRSMTRCTIDVLDIRDNPNDATSPWNVRDFADGIGGMINHGIALAEKTPKGIIRWKRDVTTYQTDNEPIQCSRFAMRGVMTSAMDMREFLDPIVGDGNASASAGVIKDMAMDRADWQIKQGILKAVDKASFTLDDLGDGFNLGYRAAPVEARYFGGITAYIARMPQNA